MDKKIKVIIDGIEMEVSVSEEELAKLTENKQNKTGYERVDKGKRYFIATGIGSVDALKDDSTEYDVSYFENANYYSDRILAGDVARADKLMRQLRRFAAENCEEAQWDNKAEHWYIRHAMVDSRIYVDSVTYAKDFGAIYFDTEENAQKAIDEFKDELLWYFTEYRDRV